MSRRSFLSLCVLLAALVAVDMVVAARGARLRLERERIAPLFTEREQEELKRTAAISLTHRGQTHLYVRAGGRWRCLSFRNAVASKADLEELHRRLLGAEGTVRAWPADSLDRYGLGEAGRFTIEWHGARMLQGPGRDVLARVELGFSAERRAQHAFAGRPGTDRLWSFETPVGRLLPAVPGTTPPLLDPHLVPGDWPPSRQPLEVLEIRYRDRPGATLRMKPRVITPEEMRAGVPPYEWTIETRGQLETTSVAHAAAFAELALRTRYREVLAPREREPLEEHQADAVLTLIDADKNRVQVLLAREQNLGDVAYVPLTQSWFLLDAATAELLKPEPAALMDPAAPNPWSEAR